MLSSAFLFLHRLYFTLFEGVIPPQHLARGWFTLMMAAAHSGPVMIHEAFLLLIGHFHIFDVCIIQPNKQVDAQLSWKCWKQSAINHFFAMPALLATVAFPFFEMYTDCTSTAIPETKTVLLHLLVCIFVEDFLFYWSHRFLHHPAIYKYVHKQHHEFKVLTGYSIASEYTHPVESIVGNVLPVMAGPYITQCHFYTTCLWVIIRMFKTCDAHSGYAFKWSPFGLCYPLNAAERHDFHHETGLGSFGSFFSLWDQWTGTDSAFLQSCIESKGRRRIFKKPPATRQKKKA